MGTPLPISILISGRGSNMRALIESAQGFKVVSVLSNKDAAGLQYAAERSIPTQIHPRSNFASRLEQQRALFSAARNSGAEFIALAGFMQIIEPEIIHEWFGRLINIHPALLPKFPGLDTHARALQSGESSHGCTVHYVDSGVDTGPLIAQARCSVNLDDSEETLASRVLTLEHQLYPWVLDQIAAGQISLTGNQTTLTNSARRSAADRQFIIPENTSCV